MTLFQTRTQHKSKENYSWNVFLFVIFNFSFHSTEFFNIKKKLLLMWSLGGWEVKLLFNKFFTNRWWSLMTVIAFVDYESSEMALFFFFTFVCFSLHRIQIADVLLNFVAFATLSLRLLLLHYALSMAVCC